MQKAFSLFELLLALALISLLLVSVAGPLASLHQQLAVRQTANALYHSLMMARAQAVIRQCPVRVCASQTGDACNGAWHQGWAVHDLACPAPVSVALSEMPAGAPLQRIVYTHRVPWRRVGIRFRAWRHPHHIIFNADGTSDNNGLFVLSGTGAGPQQPVIHIRQSRSGRSLINIF